MDSRIILVLGASLLLLFSKQQFFQSQNQQVRQTIKGENFTECLVKVAKEKVVLEAVDESELRFKWYSGGL